MSPTDSTTRALKRGQTLARAGKTDEALEAFGAAGNAEDPRVLVQCALALARTGRTESALEKSGRAAAAAPDDVVPAALNAYLLLRASRVDVAEPEIERAAKLSPLNSIPPTLAAALDLLRGRAAEGCRKLLGGPVTDNLEILGWALALVERAIHDRVGTDSGAIPPEEDRNEDADQPPEAVPARSARRCARRGEKLLESGKPRAATAYLERAVELAPDNAEHRALLGAALFEASQFERAEAEFAQAPQKGPVAGVAQFYRAANAYRLGRSETALELLDTLPMTGDAVLYEEWFDFVRGMSLVALGRTAEAAVPLAAFLDTEPDLLTRRLKKAIDILSETEQCSTPS